MRRPSFARRFRTAGPTRGSVSTPAASASGRGALRGRGQRGGGVRPAKPTGSRSAVRAGGTGTEYRTGTWSPPVGQAEPASRALRVVLEPEEADRARAGVGADDGAEVLDELDLGLRPRLRDEVGEHLDPLRRVGVGDRRRAGRARSRSTTVKTRRELLERLLAAAHLADRVDDAVVDRQDRLDVEQRAGERLGAADAAALLEVLERGDREDDAVLLLEPLDQRLDLLVGRAPREPALDREREQPDRERRGLGVDDAGSGRLRPRRPR